MDFRTLKYKLSNLKLQTSEPQCMNFRTFCTLQSIRYVRKFVL